MKTFGGPDELADVLRSLSETGLIDIVLGDGGEAGFTLSAAVTDSGPDGVAALLAWIEAVSDPSQGP